MILLKPLPLVRAICEDRWDYAESSMSNDCIFLVVSVHKGGWVHVIRRPGGAGTPTVRETWHRSSFSWTLV